MKYFFLFFILVTILVVGGLQYPPINVSIGKDKSTIATLTNSNKIDSINNQIGNYKNQIYNGHQSICKSINDAKKIKVPITESRSGRFIKKEFGLDVYELKTDSTYQNFYYKSK